MARAVAFVAALAFFGSNVADADPLVARLRF